MLNITVMPADGQVEGDDSTFSDLLHFSNYVEKPGGKN